MFFVILPYFISFVLEGALLANPGVSLDLWLRDFAFNENIFGTAIMIQGIFALLGAQIALKNITAAKLVPMAQMCLLFMGTGALLCYFAEAGFLPFFHSLSQTGQHFVRMTGIALLGLGLGANTITNNSVAMQLQNARALNILQLGFTLGAVLLSIGAGLFIQKMALASTNPYLWRAPVGFIALACIILAGALPFLPSPSNFINRQSAAKIFSGSEIEVAESGKVSVLPRIFAGIILFTYVGSEINLSIWLSTLSEKVLQVPADLSRYSAGYFWGGLFLARLYTAFSKIKVAKIPRAVMILSGLTLLFFVLLQVSFFRTYPPLSNVLWSLLVLFCGVSIGSIYGLCITSSLTFYNSKRSAHEANIIALFGAAGSVLVPPLLSFWIDTFGISKSPSFLSGSLAIMFASSVVLFFLNRPKLKVNVADQK